MTVPLLELRAVCSGHGRTQTLREVDLSVPAGSTVALLGPNGAGKTTLLRTVAGLVPLRSGEIRFDGTRVNRLPPHGRARSGICLIPEGRGIFRGLSVRENLVVQADSGGAPVAVERAATLFPVLGQRLRQLAGTLSGGEQQMLALARAFVVNAPLVMADELSMGLAPVVVDQIFDALRVLRAEGRSVLLVEQYIERAVGVADHVYILKGGRIVFSGPPSGCSSTAVFASYLDGAA